MDPTRRSMISAVGLGFPFVFDVWGDASDAAGRPPVIRFLPFEEAVREAFRGHTPLGDEAPCRRVEVGWSEDVQAGLQGCHNDRPFAGFPAGHLRIVRAGFEPGPLLRGVRLQVCAVEVVLGGRRPDGVASRPLDFAKLPPAPVLT